VETANNRDTDSSKKKNGKTVLPTGTHEGKEKPDDGGHKRCATRPGGKKPPRSEQKMGLLRKGVGGGKVGEGEKRKGRRQPGGEHSKTRSTSRGKPEEKKTTTPPKDNKDLKAKEGKRPPLRRPGAFASW